MARYRHHMSPRPRWLTSKGTNDGLPDLSTWPAWLQEANADQGRRLLKRARLHQIVPPPGVDWSQLNGTPLRRGRAELDCLITGARRETYAPRREGILDALEWVRGERAESPVMRLRPVGSRPMLLEIAAEAADARTGVLRGDMSDEEINQWEYGEAASLTYQWLMRTSAIPPLDTVPPVQLHSPVRLPDPSRWPDTFTDEVSRRGRLPSDGHSVRSYSLHVSDEDWETLNLHPVVRDSAELAAVRAQVAADLQHPPDSRFTAGVAAAFEWAFGEQPVAPWTERATVGDRPTWTEIAGEIAATEENISLGPAQRRDEEYCVGVEHALMWLIGDTPNPPAGPHELWGWLPART